MVCMPLDQPLTLPLLAALSVCSTVYGPQFLIDGNTQGTNVGNVAATTNYAAAGQTVYMQV
jgi:hypothetical protein